VIDSRGKKTAGSHKKKVSKAKPKIGETGEIPASTYPKMKKGSLKHRNVGGGKKSMGVDPPPRPQKYHLQPDRGKRVFHSWDPRTWESNKKKSLSF